MENRFKEFTVLVNNIQYYINKLKTEQMSKLGLKGAHVTCLYYLHNQPNGLTATALCDICGEDKAAISRSVDYLETNGYIMCKSKTAKRYNSLLTLTPKGINAAQWVADTIDGVLNIASSGISNKDRESLYNSLHTIKDNLESLYRNMEE